MGYILQGTKGTAKFFQNEGVKIDYIKSENIENAIQKSDLLINIPTAYAHEKKTKGYILRRTAIDSNIPLITNIQIAKLMVKSLKKYPHSVDLPITSVDEFV